MSEKEFETFLEDQKKEGVKKLVGWMIILILFVVFVIGGMFLLFDSAVRAFLG